MGPDNLLTQGYVRLEATGGGDGQVVRRNIRHLAAVGAAEAPAERERVELRQVGVSRRQQQVACTALGPVAAGVFNGPIKADAGLCE